MFPDVPTRYRFQVSSKPFNLPRLNSFKITHQVSWCFEGFAAVLGPNSVAFTSVSVHSAWWQ